MAENTELSAQEFGLEPSPFGNLFLSPYEVDFGSEEKEERLISVKGLKIRLGDRPIAKNLRQLYKLKHEAFPDDLAVFDAYDIWLLFHSIGAIRREGNADVRVLGYEAKFENEEDIYTIEMLPHSKFCTRLGASFKSVVDLGIEGKAQVPEELKEVLDAIDLVGGDVKLSLSTELKSIGRLSFSVITPTIQAIGIGASRCEWCFHAEEKPLLGDQIMIQTVLVRPHTKTLKFKIRGYALIKTGWVGFPAMYRTKWLDVECPLS